MENQKKAGYLQWLQMILAAAALVLAVVGIIRIGDVRRMIIYIGQAVVCVLLLIPKFSRYRVIFVVYAAVEALRAASLSTTGVNPVVAVMTKLIPVALAMGCLLLSERMDNKESGGIAFCLLALEVAEYLLFLFGFPGIMYGRLNRLLPLAGVLIAGSIFFFVRARSQKEEAKNWKPALAVLLCFCIAGGSLLGASLTSRKPGKVLSLWTEGTESRKAFLSYMNAITDETSPDFIPVEDRIAVFDFDGTLFCETDPNYFDYMLLLHRVLEDPDYKNRASDFEKETAEKIVHLNETGEAADGLEVDHGKAIASSFAGMTLDEFKDYVKEFAKTPMVSYDGMTRGTGWYLPMLQIVDYLKEKNFTVYIVSGTDRFIVRGIADGASIDLPEGQIIGSDENTVATGQGEEDGLKYVYTDQDKLVTGGEFIVKNLKMNKVTVIAQEIGSQPVLSFGNSSGDASMAEYVTTNNPYRSLAFMLCCDDTERENGNIEKADKMYSMCEEFDWVPISMKNDWTTIYGDSVTKK